MGRLRAPAALLCIVFYWNTPEPSPFTRVHEFIHVAQDEANPFFLVFWVKYLAQHFRHGYRGNRYEREAYETERDARANGLPEWARADAAT